MNIADGMRNITKNIIAAHNVRVKALGDLLNDVSESLADARKLIQNDAADRKAMSAKQAAELARFADGLAKSVSAKLKGFQKDRALSAKELKSRLQKEAEDLKKKVQKTLADYHKDHADMSEALRHNLQGSVKDILKAVVDLRPATRGMMRGYREDMREARNIWSNMTRTRSEVGIKEAELPVIKGEEKVGTLGQVIHRIQRRKRSKK